MVEKNQTQKNMEKITEVLLPDLNELREMIDDDSTLFSMGKGNRDEGKVSFNEGLLLIPGVFGLAMLLLSLWLSIRSCKLIRGLGHS